MKKEIRGFLKMFVLSTVFMGINYFTILYFENPIIKISLTIVFAIGLSLVLLKINSNSGIDEIIKYLSNINNLDFSNDIDIPKEAREKLQNGYKQIRENLKNQIEISTEIFNICESLSLLATESLSSSELIASSAELVDSSVSEQSQMLNETNNLAEKNLFIYGKNR